MNGTSISCCTHARQQWQPWIVAGRRRQQQLGHHGGQESEAERQGEVVLAQGRDRWAQGQGQAGQQNGAAVAADGCAVGRKAAAAGVVSCGAAPRVACLAHTTPAAAPLFTLRIHPSVPVDQVVPPAPAVVAGAAVGAAPVRRIDGGVWQQAATWPPQPPPHPVAAAAAAVGCRQGQRGWVLAPVPPRQCALLCWCAAIGCRTSSARHARRAASRSRCCGGGTTAASAARSFVMRAAARPSTAASCLALMATCACATTASCKSASCW